MISVQMDQFGRESRTNYDFSGKSFDPEIDRMGRVFLAFNLEKFGTFETFMDDPNLFYSRASGRGDFWEMKHERNLQAGCLAERGGAASPASVGRKMG